MARYRVTGPDGKSYEVNAPDTASQEEVLAYVKKNASLSRSTAPASPVPAPAVDTQDQPSIVGDALKSAGSGIVKGVLGIGSLPGNIEHLGRMGIDASARALGYQDPKTSEGWIFPHYGHYKDDLERRLGVKLHEPETTTGKYIETAASFIPGAAALPGTITQKAITGVAGPAIGSEIAGQATKDTAAEPVARVVGALVGAKAAPVVADAAVSTARGLTAPLRAMVNPERVASEKVGEALARDLNRPGVVATADDIADRAQQRIASMTDQGQPARLVDVGGDNMRGLLRASANMPNEARDQVRRSLDTRQGNQWARIEQAADRGLVPGKRFEQTVDDIIAARDAAADPAFKAAFQNPTPLTPGLVDVLNRPTIQAVGQRVERQLLDEGKALSPVNNTEWLHRVKLELDYQIGQSKLAEKMGNTPQAGFDTKTLTILKKDLLNNIQHPAYKKALNDYAGPSALKTAAERGEAEFLKSSVHEIRNAMKTMTPAEQEMYRLGAKDAIFSRLESPNVTRDLTDGFFGSAGIQARLAALFPDQKQLREFQKALIVEAKMADTRKAAQGNSTTAKQLAEGAEAGKNATLVKSGVNAIGGLAHGRLSPAVDFVGQVHNRFSGLTPRVAAEIMRIQMGRDPLAALDSVRGGLQRATAAPIREVGYTRGIPAAYQAPLDINGILEQYGIPTKRMASETE